MEEQPLLPIRHIRNDNQVGKKDDVVIQVKNNLNKLLDSAAVDEMGPLGESTQPSIYKIPEFMRKIQAKAFEPQLVSLGPYHHGKEHLVSMEEEKQKAFRRFVNDYGLNLESIVESMSNNLENLWGAYDKLDEKWKQDGAKFLEVMIVDGCFMLDFFKECPYSLSTMRWDIKRDMLLLENQLPMQLLQELYDNMPNTNQEDQSLRSLICQPMCINEEAVMGRELHILDMYRASLLYPPVDRKDRSGKTKVTYQQSDPECQIIPQATQLHDAGIKFKSSPTKNLTDVSFNPKQGVLELPYIVVDDDTETTLLNVMAFEKLYVEAGSKVTSFVILMNNLIDVDRDVALLASDKILANALGNDESAADLFSLLGKGAAMDLDSHITDVHYKVNKHCSLSWNQWCASLKHDYFQNPWAIISLFAAVFGFAILIVQAIYQIVDYHRGN
ncbi:UPF0481 protein At3g47200-like [Benincasa hispida]|uniref:UPF0481 protein At3g47200-like n=1 Tax=Benincasa hispida TaxID=102211 RepID=UPI0019026650|nr:UPF0481 protein At3g47200-like [Benincasa hispida]